MYPRKRKTYWKAVAFGALCIGIVILSVMAFGLVESLLNRADGQPLPGLSHESGENENRILYNDAWYRQRKDLETILVLGIDRSTDGTLGSTDSEQADFFALLLIDKEAESFQILHLNRDTMADIPVLDIAGAEYATKYAQLALAHTYGSNEEMRCRNAVNAVERLLYGIEIDHYISLSMDAVAILNDSVGGVTLQIREDLTAIDPSFSENAVVTLKGKLALDFVRARGSLEDSSNLSRMERQRQYIGALFEAFTASDISEESTFETLLKVNEHMVSDCTVDQLSAYVEKMKECAYDGIHSLAGDAVKGAEYMEYYIDETSARATVIELFYEICE